MANVNDSELGIGRLYAEAILDLAEEAGQGDALLEELNGAGGVCSTGAPELEQLLASPLVDEEARVRVIEDAFRGRASDLLVDSLQVINRKGRLGSLRAIAEAYRAALPGPARHRGRPRQDAPCRSPRPCARG